MSKGKSKGKKPPRKRPPKKTATAGGSVNPKNGTLETDVIVVDGVLCDKRTRLPV